jgi:predicted phosphodiesterase
MRIAVVSDIHGNWFALRSVLDDAKRQGAQEIWCLGDVVGYGPQSWECYQELIGLEAGAQIPVTAWIAGNHDWGLAGKIPLEFPYFRDEAAWVLRRIRELTPPEALEEMCRFLGERPTFQEASRPGIWLAHGWVAHTTGSSEERANVVNELSYIWDREDNTWKAKRTWQALGRPQMILVGHTHQTMLWHRQNGNHWASLLGPRQSNLSPPPGWLEGCPDCGNGPCQSRKDWGQSIILPNGPVLINPGSVGQPRDGCPAAAYAILDLDEDGNQVTFRRVGYNVEATLNNFARLARTADGGMDMHAIQTYIPRLREALKKGEGVNE